MATKTTKETKKDTKKDDSAAGNTGVDAASKAAGADEAKRSKKAKREGSSKPSEPGERDGEVKNGYRWDKAASDWVEHRGTDFTEDDAKLPHNMEHVGDGSPEKPHQIRPQQRWS